MDMRPQGDATEQPARPDTSGVPPVERAIRVLRYIAAGQTCSNITNAAKEIGINRTTLIRLLHTLSEERMIERRDDGRGYALGFGLIGLAAQAISERDLLRVARPRLARLAADLGLSAHLGVLDNHEVVYLIREVPRTHLVSNVGEGSRLPAYATTMGRMMLAHLPEDKINALYKDRKMRVYSKATATTRAELRRQLAADGEAGLVWSDGNFEPSIGSCACPVFDHERKVIAAINVSGGAADFTVGTPRSAEIEAGVREAAKDLSRSLGCPDIPG